MKMAINLQLFWILATILLFSELTQQTSQIRLNNRGAIRSRKDIEVPSGNENNVQPLEKTSLDQAPSSEPSTYGSRRLNHRGTIRSRKDNEVPSDNENNVKPLEKTSLNQAPSSETTTYGSRRLNNRRTISSRKDIEVPSDNENNVKPLEKISLDQAPSKPVEKTSLNEAPSSEPTTYGSNRINNRGTIHSQKEIEVPASDSENNVKPLEKISLEQAPSKSVEKTSFNEAPSSEPTTYNSNRSNNRGTIRSQKEIEVPASNTENNIKPLEKTSLNQAPSSEPTPYGTNFIRFPNAKLKILKTPTNHTLIPSVSVAKDTPTKTAHPLSPKLPAKLIDNKVISGQSANVSTKAKSGQLSIKQTPENLQARRTPIETKPVSNSYAKLKKPVPSRVSSPAEVTETPGAFSKRPANKDRKLSRKLNESTTEMALNSSSSKPPVRVKSNPFNSTRVVPKFKNLMALSRLKPVES